MFLLQNSSITDQITSSWDKLSVKINGWVDSAVLYLPNFLVALLVFIFFLLLAKYVGKLINKIFHRSIRQASIRIISVRIVKTLIVLLGFFIAVGVMNLSTLLVSILGAAGVIALAIGLALQDTLSNTFSGVILSFLPKLQIGDWVETNGYAGFVTDINLRCVVIKPANNNLVMIPNTKIIQEPFTNFSTLSRSRIIINCGVGYESDLELVQKIVIETIGTHFKPQGSEEVEFFYQEFGESSINFIVRFWTDCVNSKDEYKAENKAIILIKKAFDENNINIPFPIRTLDFDKNKFRAETLRVENISTENTED
ncbi:MAG TPA: mechanosensitive ion channel family protein [Salinimicrobium sp.]|nr:mechanosensitive ion channel family protein [Salinimicrobium sp.]